MDSSEEKLEEANEEISELTRLYWEAVERQRKLTKTSGNQSWGDWLLELIGF